MRRAAVLLLLLCLTLVACAPAGGSACLKRAPAVPPDARRTNVTRVVDGDTFIVDGGERVRLIGINAPESADPRRPVQRMGKEASDFARALLEGKEIRLQEGRTSRDSFGRILAWVWLSDGRFVNAELVRLGYAQVYTFSDNPDHADYLRLCQREARAAQRGLWAP